MDVDPRWSEALLSAEAARAPDHGGEGYLEVLGRLHRHLSPATYLEIGTATGLSLSAARCASIAIDPELRITGSVLEGKPTCLLYQTSSDDFFARHDPTAILGRPIDLAFLDGMHWFEYLLRDFINVERHCRPNSIVAIHDCIPTDIFVGRRDRPDQDGHQYSAHPDWWAGDVWKIVGILKRHRPDLPIMALDAGPTGLILVTRLDPTSTILRDRYYDVVDEATPTTLRGFGLHAFLAGLNIQPTTVLAQGSQIARHFWL